MTPWCSVPVMWRTHPRKHKRSMWGGPSARSRPLGGFLVGQQEPPGRRLRADGPPHTDPRCFITDWKRESITKGSSSVTLDYYLWIMRSGLLGSAAGPGTYPAGVVEPRGHFLDSGIRSRDGRDRRSG